MSHEFGTEQSEASNRPKSEPLPTPAQMAAVLPHAPNQPFMLKEHPLRWHLVDGEWLPQLGYLRFEMGANGVDKTGDISIARLEAEKRGWKIIPYEVIKDGYVTRTRCEGGWFHHLRWEEPRAIGKRVLDSRVDSEGYRDFLRMLVDEGFVREPDPDVLEQAHIEVQRKRVDNLRKQAAKPGFAPYLQREQARLEEMEEGVTELRESRGEEKVEIDRYAVRAELDALGVEYQKNAKTDKLVALLAKARKGASKAEAEAT